MSDRLRHLHRQQALLREHLAWLEDEVARETGTPDGSATQTAVSVIAPIAGLSATDSTVDADALIERYATAERQKPADVRRGCLLIFGAALLLIASGVAAIWMFFYR